MIIMGLEEEYQQALTFVEKLNFHKSNGASKGFETNIRYLGGLLSAYDLRGDEILLTKAIELADGVLMPLFDTPTGAPYTYFNVINDMAEVTETINLAEFGTYTVEFTRLSQITGDLKYVNAANGIVDKAIAQPSRMPGLYPNDWTVDPFKPLDDAIVNVGAGGDSFYEYLIKNYILSEKQDEKVLEAWVNAVNSIEKYLLSPTQEDPNVQFVATITNMTVKYQSDELICFWPGNILLGISQMSGDTTRQQKFAQTFMNSCLETWFQTETGLAPEIWSWNPKTLATQKNTKDEPNGTVSDPDNSEYNAEKSKRPFTIRSSVYGLRPETIESVFYYDRIVGGTAEDPEYYKTVGWKIFQSIEKYTKTESGYSIIKDVDDASSTAKLDFQESFYFAETLKYLYLLFSDDSCMSLNDYVYTTEAHPLKLPRSLQVQK
ncbi:glycoside hydrolase [Circinella umbellata]|nr:glycoside hydrolase [Circinella umbellata]